MTEAVGTQGKPTVRELANSLLSAIDEAYEHNAEFNRQNIKLVGENDKLLLELQLAKVIRSEESVEQMLLNEIGDAGNSGARGTAIANYKLYLDALVVKSKL